MGGSELSCIHDLISNDHEWRSKHVKCGGIKIRLLPCNCCILVKLFWDVAPLACKTFATLCSNGSDNQKPLISKSGKPLTPTMYLDTQISQKVIGGVECWTMTSEQYVKVAIANIDAKLDKTGQ
jgi:hypothetical protein